jgi:hypothetical protein
VFSLKSLKLVDDSETFVVVLEEEGQEEGLARVRGQGGDGGGSTSVVATTTTTTMTSGRR